MPKVCVVTFYKRNYGAFLQAYAFQKYLESNGFDATVLNYNYYKDRTVLGVYLGRIKRPVAFIKSLAYTILRYPVSSKRDRVMKAGADRLIKQTDCFNSYRKLKKYPPIADIYLVGSDQVWNPNMAEQGLLSRLLDFAPKGKSVLCSYAASLGTTKLSEHSKTLFTEKLKRFSFISVRESSSVEMLKEATSLDIQVHKDPTLLLKTSEWSQFAVKTETDKPYVFLYLAQNSPELVSYAKKIAAQNNWGILDCQSSANYKILDSICGDRILSPMEFVGGIRDAAYVVTNSFHCLVFSIHFRKKAFVKLPPKGSERLSELIDGMNLFRLKDEKEMTDQDVLETYKEVTSFLDRERRHAKEYIGTLKAAVDSSSK